MVSPNGRYLAYTQTADIRQGYNGAKLTIRDLRTSESRSLTTDFDRSVSDIQWSQDSKSLWISYTDLGMVRVAKIDLRGKLRQSDIVVGGTAIGLSLIHISEPTRPY